VTSEEHDHRGNQGAYLRARTHCPRRHPYDENNTRLDRNGRRHCRTCDQERDR
jgi:hypothetical protein